jgi:hypothetical protein
MESHIADYSACLLSPSCNSQLVITQFKKLHNLIFALQFSAVTTVFSRERSSTGSNDCFVVVVLVLVVGIFIL